MNEKWEAGHESTVTQESVLGVRCQGSGVRYRTLRFPTPDPRLPTPDSGGHGDATGAFKLDSALVPDPDEQRVIARLDAAQVERQCVRVADVKAPTIEPDFDPTDREVGVNREPGAAPPGAFRHVESPAGWGGIVVACVAEEAVDERIQVGVSVALKEVEHRPRRGQLVGEDRDLLLQ